MYVNTVSVVGNLTSDPQLTENEVPVINFRVAVNRMRKAGTEAEEFKDRTEFIDVECWGSQANHISSSLRKGDRAIIVGELKQDRWNDSEGNPRSRLRIKALAVGTSLEFSEVNA